jgi:hypothetical protein
MIARRPSLPNPAGDITSIGFGMRCALAIAVGMLPGRPGPGLPA